MPMMLRVVRVREVVMCVGVRAVEHNLGVVCRRRGREAVLVVRAARCGRPRGGLVEGGGIMLIPDFIGGSKCR